MTVKYYVNAEGRFIGAWDSGSDAPHPGLPIGAIEVPDAPPNSLMVWDGESFVVSKEQLISHAANSRFLKETGGILVGGITVTTDDRSKQMVLGARVAADANPAFSTPWVGADGSVTVINAATMIDISNAVLAHVAACFSTFAQVKEDIEAGTVSSLEEIDAAFFPSEGS